MTMNFHPDHKDSRGGGAKWIRRSADERPGGRSKSLEPFARDRRARQIFASAGNFNAGATGEEET
jgi:hypothetical protein